MRIQSTNRFKINFLRILTVFFIAIDDIAELRWIWWPRTVNVRDWPETCGCDVFQILQTTRSRGLLMVIIAFSFVRCVWNGWNLLLDCVGIAGCHVIVADGGYCYWVISITAGSPLVDSVANEAPGKSNKKNRLFMRVVRSSVVSIVGDIPWIVKALRVSTWVVRFAAIVPGADLATVQFAWIETGYEILFARGTDATRFARYSKVTPSAFTFFGFSIFQNVFLFWSSMVSFQEKELKAI